MAFVGTVAALSAARRAPAICARASAFVAPSRGRSPALPARALATRAATMTIKEGDALPIDGVKLMVLGASGPEAVEIAPLFKNKKTVLFAIPGCFTSTCQNSHFPSFAGDNAKALKAKGVDEIVCVAVNDPFVAARFSETMAVPEIKLFADGDAAWVKSMGLETDLGAFGGTRSSRWSMLVEDGVVTKAFLEGGPGYTNISGGAHMVENI